MQQPQYFLKMALIPLALTIGVAGCNGNPDRIIVQPKPTSPATTQCTETQIKTSINRLGKGDRAAFNFLVSCNSQAVPALIKLLKHKDENIRIVAIAILGQIGEGATEAIPLLEEVLKDRREENEDSRIMVVDALGKIMGQAAVPALIAALKDQDSLVRTEAASALGQIGQPAVPALIAALKDQDSEVRSQAALALGQIGKEAKDAVPALIVALKNESWLVRYRAASALGEIGQDAKDAAPELTVIARNDRCLEPREAAIQSLRQIIPNQVDSFSSQLEKIDPCSPPTISAFPAPALGKASEREKRANPPVMCRYPLVRAILLWKCPYAL
jgi:vesicle coat complex subunit